MKFTKLYCAGMLLASTTIQAATTDASERPGSAIGVVGDITSTSPYIGSTSTSPYIGSEFSGNITGTMPAGTINTLTRADIEAAARDSGISRIAEVRERTEEEKAQDRAFHQRLVRETEAAFKPVIERVVGPAIEAAIAATEGLTPLDRRNKAIETMVKNIMVTALKYDRSDPKYTPKLFARMFREEVKKVLSRRSEAASVSAAAPAVPSAVAAAPVPAGAALLDS